MEENILEMMNIDQGIVWEWWYYVYLVGTMNFPWCIRAVGDRIVCWNVNGNSAEA